MSVEGSGYHLMFAQTGYSEMLEIDVVELGAAVPPGRRASSPAWSAPISSRSVAAAARHPGHGDVGRIAPTPSTCWSASSGYDAGRLMGEHFGERGFRRIAYSGHTIERGAQRIEGFRSGLRQARR